MKCECCGKIYKSLDCFKSHQTIRRTCFISQMLNVENIKEHLNALNPKVGQKYKKLLEDTEKERGEYINDLIGLLIKSLFFYRNLQYDLRVVNLRFANRKSTTCES